MSQATWAPERSLAFKIHCEPERHLVEPKPTGARAPAAPRARGTEGGGGGEQPVSEAGWASAAEPQPAAVAAQAGPPEQAHGAEEAQPD